MAAEKDDKGHFTGLGECKIHTSRSHDACSNKPAGCDHQANCDDAPVKTKEKWGTEWESHHVLCVSCVNAYKVLEAYSAADRDFIDKCYRKTEWCINKAPNLIALPMKLVYQRYPRARGMNLPCHDWDHNNTGGYTDEVTEDIHLNVWQKLKEHKAGDKPCELAKTVVAKELVSAAKRFKNKLSNKRGHRPGTQAAWDEPKKASLETEWWFSFSMAKDDVARMRPATEFGKPHWTSAEERVELRERLAEVKNKG